MMATLNADLLYYFHSLHNKADTEPSACTLPALIARGYEVGEVSQAQTSTGPRQGSGCNGNVFPVMQCQTSSNMQEGDSKSVC